MQAKQSATVGNGAKITVAPLLNHWQLFIARRARRGHDLGEQMVAYATGQPVKPATDNLESVDYNPLLGFVAPAVRIDPHSHEVEAAAQSDLRQIADIVGIEVAPMSSLTNRRNDQRL